MNSKIAWKLVLTACVLIFAWGSMTPFKATPFNEYIDNEVSANQEDFNALVDRANAMVEDGEVQSLYVALRRVADADQVDLTTFFPHIAFSDVKNVSKRNSILMDELLLRSQSKLKQGLDLKGGVSFTLAVQDEDASGEILPLSEDKLLKAIEIIRDRVNGMGLSEPVIRAKGEGLIEVQLPGLDLRQNPEVQKQVRAPAKLEFSEVYYEASGRNSALAGGEAPLGYKKLFEERELDSGEIVQVPIFVSKFPLATGEIISEAFPYQNNFGGYEISLKLTSDGSDVFAALTKQLANKGSPNAPAQLAIILDGKLYSAPSVREEIRGGSASISGNFSQREAFELSSVLNNPLDVELEIVEESQVGATLAEDALHSSLQACMWAAGLVAIFMIIYYGLAGVVSVISVAVNIFIVIGVLASMKATLTLPGIAALVLTVGMAVDANILIFERIREELKLGKKAKTALWGGYEKALSTIVDANVTTLITASILIFLGTGSVKGFGVTLAIGICASMFCALIVSRFLLEIFVEGLHIKKVLGIAGLRLSDKDFLNFRKPAFVFSWAIVALGVVMFVVNIDSVFGIDFRGGEELSVRYAQEIPTKAVLDLAEAQNLGEVLAVKQTTILELGKEVDSLKLQTEPGQGDAVLAALNEAYPDSQLELVGQTAIGATVSSTIAWNAVWSVSFALLGILLYVALRFEIGYGVGAVVATIHDVLMSVGVYVLLGGQFSAPMIAAVLMIVGYSINDTIVVFDRIREELDLNPGTNLKKIVNLAISRVFSRSILTSVTTLISATVLYIFGSGVINDFALIFMIGIVTGTFSSIFIASPVFYWWHKGSRDHVEAHELKPHTYEWQSTTKAAK